MARPAALVALAAALAAAWFAAAQPEKPAPARVPWGGSKVTGSPEPPPPFKSVRVFPNVKFDQPLLVARAPGLNRLFFAERRGALYSVDATNPDAKADLFLDLRKELKTLHLKPEASGVESTYALAFHPKFEQNRYCYVCYTLQAKDRKVRHLPDGSRISRFTVAKTDPPRVDPASEEIVITWEQGGHNGCDIHFGPDGMLYFTTGDAREPSPPDALNTGQDCSDLLSSVIRIDVDRKDAGKNYAVPKDNPFVGVKDVRGEIWAYGFRNPWRMSFDRQTGDLWLGDVGWELWEMVHKVEKGGNYGWSITEARQPIKPDQKPGPNPVVTPPMIELPHTISASVNGGYVYRGKKFPELVGAFVFGDWETRKIWAARFENGRLKEMPEITRPDVRTVAFGEDHDGELYYVDYDAGTVHTLERNAAGAANKDFPTTLSATGLFADVRKHTPAPGVEPFRPAVSQWADHATSEYWLALPGTSKIKLYTEGKPIAGNVYWHNFRMHYPKDAVLVKTLSLDMVKGDPLTRKRVETQLLHYDGVDWRGYSFKWRDDQADADLVPADGGEAELTVKDATFPGGVRHQTWTFHSRTQCLQCHSAWTKYTLAFNPEQLNYAERGGNVLAGFGGRGFLTRLGKKDESLPPHDAEALAAEPKLADPHGGDPLEARARSYLHVNCGHCHRFGGGGAVQLQLHREAEAKAMQAIDVRPQRGDFGLPDAKLIAPGDPHRSTLYYRMAKFGRERMPQLGSEFPDEAGLALMEAWIRSLGKSAPVDVNKPLAHPAGAMTLARQLGGGKLKPEEVTGVLQAVAKMPPGGNRDFFDGYLPPDPKGRKLGQNPRPAPILAHTGDAKRGEALFWSAEMKCGNCHKVGDRGTAVGPDLSATAKTRSRADLLESVLEPSRRVEPQFTAYNVRTLDGRSFTGLLVKRDDKQVVLRDAENKEIVLAADNVDGVKASRVSLMPDGGFAGLTAREAADVLEYLATRK